MFERNCFNEGSSVFLTCLYFLQDENARIAMCESQAWLPIASLFGLLGCPVSANLKAHLLRTLAAFAISPEIASSMWHTLELSQVHSEPQADQVN